MFKPLLQKFSSITTMTKIPGRKSRNDNLESKISNVLSIYKVQPTSPRVSWCLSNNNLSLNRSTVFDSKDDLLILNKVLTEKPTWLELADSMKRQYDKVRYRYYYHLKPKIVNHSTLKKIPYHQSLLEMIKSLQTGREFEISPIKKWDLESDLKLLRLVYKVGPIFRLFSIDFPGYSTVFLWNKFAQMATNGFTVEQDEKILEYFGTGDYDPSDFANEFPGSSRKDVLTRLELIKEGKTLTRDNIAQLSKLVEKHGRQGLQESNLPLPVKSIYTEWAYNEPRDQINPIWGREKDSILWDGMYLRKEKSVYQFGEMDIFNGYSSTELSTRIKYLLHRKAVNPHSD